MEITTIELCTIIDVIITIELISESQQAISERNENIQKNV